MNSMMKEVPRLSAVESVAVRAAYGRIAASDIVVSFNVPEFTKSHMDGFAIISEDTRSATKSRPVRLQVVGSVKLGSTSRISIKRRESSRVATGSRVPHGADAVVPVENVVEKGRTIIVNSSIEKGSFVYRRGEDLQKGEIGVVSGTTIRAQDIGLLTALGTEKISVVARPRVGILATGSELTDSARPSAGKIRNSHTPIFERMVEAVGCVSLDMGIARDNEPELRGKILAALDNADLVLTLGGTSVGERDLVGKVITELNPELFLHGIRMDRGRVTGVAVVQGKPIVMMPGPIQGAMNAFVLFALPLLRRLQGRREDELTVRAELEDGWAARPRFSHFTKVVYVRLHSKGGGLLAEPGVAETESIRLLTRSNGFVIVPERTVSLRRGGKVRVLILPGFSVAS